ncbi:hypothetical protein [Asticcacaulis sp. W401b]|uniref:hypothetical protein n=1 Tax=Asticcacaulis sp. W401b TaxID=3388666 RepID=UPI0039709545
MQNRVMISTWFVEDSAAEATYFPQIGSLSNTSEAKLIYWRCVAAFYASSIHLNSEEMHVFFTNTDLPRVDGVELSELFQHWGVKIVRLPVTYRLPQNSVGSWGNQFYIFDILNYLTETPIAEVNIVLDSDVIWIKSAESIVDAIQKNGALTYCFSESEYKEAEPINGRTRQQMAAFCTAQGGVVGRSVDYDGGEIYAARQDVTERLVSRVRSIWPKVIAGEPNAPLEEAHLLSILYALEGIEQGTANPYIRRMWTTFKHNNLSLNDSSLTLWHLPSEKKTGFADLFAKIASVSQETRADPRKMEFLNYETYSNFMGWPKRKPQKLLRDLFLKIREKI